MALTDWKSYENREPDLGEAQMAGEERNPRTLILKSSRS